MLRIGLLTYHFSDNCGALLQAYALRKWFLARGHEAEFINYHPSYVEEGGAFDAPFNPRKWRKNVTILYMKASHLRRRLFGSRRQAREFVRFRRDVLGVTGPRIENALQLGAIQPCDLLICGSDQIWSPSIQRGLDPVYFLDFPGAKRARRISYAPSFGRASLDPAYAERAGQLIGALDAVSVREASGADIVGLVAGRDAVCVPDPTLLLNDISDLLPAGGVGQTGHVFCYALRSGEPIRQVAECVAAELGATIISPHNPVRRWREIGTTIYPSPTEWLGYLDAAAFVVSNSFHGVALSIVLKKPFVAVALDGGKRGLSERIVNLLKQVGLSDRMISEAQTDKVKSILSRPIDWQRVEETSRDYHRAGEEFLLAQMQAALAGKVV